MTQFRQLAAIMFTNILDYTSLMQQETQLSNSIKKIHHENIETGQPFR